MFGQKLEAHEQTLLKGAGKTFASQLAKIHLGAFRRLLGKGPTEPCLAAAAVPVPVAAAICRNIFKAQLQFKQTNHILDTNFVQPQRRRRKFCPAALAKKF